MRVNEFGQPVGPDVTWSPATRPPGVPLVGERVRLELLTAAHAPGLFASLNRPGHERDWTYLPAGPFDDLGLFTEWVREMAGDPGRLAYSVLVEGEPVGTASYLRIEPRMGTIELGYVHFGPALRGTPASSEAFELFAEHVFGLGFRRYEWKCDALNARSRAAAERLGFSYEGTWRNATIYKGRSRDTAWYAMTDDDFRHAHRGG